MKKIYILIAIFVLSTNLFSQQQVINSDFETWDLYPGSNGYPDYENPNPDGTWATGNLSSHLTLGVTPMTEKTTDCVSGNYAVKMTTQEIFNLPAAGSCWLGTLTMSGYTPITTFGIPYTDKPNYFNGYYKYIPVQGDSCHIYAYLSKWNIATGKRDTIAWTALLGKTTVSTYHTFSLEFDYYLQDTPDSITMVFTSSANGENYEGQIGSTLYIDNVKLSMTDDIKDVNSSFIVDVFPNPTNGTIKIVSNINTETNYSIFNINGQNVKSGNINSKLEFIDLSDLISGIYFIKIKNINGNLIKKIIKN